MKIFGIFRGFPGLGRVVAGAGILKELSLRGHDVRAYSYLQGKNILDEYKLRTIISEQPDERHIMIIGLNPISRESGKLIDEILKENPDLVIVDGEPLLISTLSMVFPREKILSLLNPSDIENKSLPLSTIKFYRSHYLSAAHAFVHGVSIENYSKIAKEYSCKIQSVQTILRPEILNLSKINRGDYVVGILGGGSKMVSKNFFNSTISMAKNIISLAHYLTDKNFIIYCNDSEVYTTLKKFLPKNLELVGDYTPPEIIYSKADVVLCRAGRNTVSELLFLKIPALLYSTAGDFRSSEQDKNIEDVCTLSQGLIQKCSVGTTAENLAEQLEQVLNVSGANFNFSAGNEEMLKYIDKLQRN